MPFKSNGADRLRRDGCNVDMGEGAYGQRAGLELLLKVPAVSVCCAIEAGIPLAPWSQTPVSFSKCVVEYIVVSSRLAMTTHRQN